jgi:hypothetical protein
MRSVVQVIQLPEVSVMKQQLAVRRRVTPTMTPQEKAERLADLRRRHQLEIERDARSLVR